MDQAQNHGAAGTGTLDLGPQQLQAAAALEELPAQETESVVDWNALPFKTTAELEPRIHADMRGDVVALTIGTLTLSMAREHAEQLRDVLTRQV